MPSEPLTDKEIAAGLEAANRIKTSNDPEFYLVDIEAVCDLLPRALAEVVRLRTFIGHPPVGSHPKEWEPRADTWHKARANWAAEVAMLGAEWAKDALARHDEGGGVAE